MTNEAVQFFLGAKDISLVFGKADAFLLLPLGRGESPDNEIIDDGLARGFRIVGYVGTCKHCGRIATHDDLKTADSELTMTLAVSGYAAHRTLRARQVSQLQSLYQTNQPQTVESMIWSLWELCLTTARNEREIPACAVELLIRNSREIIADAGYTRRESDLVLFDVYTRVHWDWNHPTARLFETLLEFELQDFFNERIPNKFGVH